MILFEDSYYRIRYNERHAKHDVNNVPDSPNGKCHRSLLIRPISVTVMPWQCNMFRSNWDKTSN